MIAGLLQLLFGLGFLAGVCFLTYKITLPIGLKMIDLCCKSARFRIGICIFLAAVFCAVGLVQLNDFFEETGSDLARFFPLSFFASSIFLVLAQVHRTSLGKPQ
jgi:hypothetical protein